MSNIGFLSLCSFVRGHQRDIIISMSLVGLQ